MRGVLLRKLGCCDCEGCLQQSSCAVADKSGKSEIFFWLYTDGFNFTENVYCVINNDVDHCQFLKVIAHVQPPHIHSTCKVVFSQNVVSLITYHASRD